MKICINALSECDTIYMLDNHRSSAGARAELEFARASGMTIIYENGDQDIII